MPSTNLRLRPFFMLIWPNPPVHQSHHFQLLTASIICPPTFLNQAVISICCSHLHFFFLSFGLLHGVFKGSGLVFLSISLLIPKQSKVLQLVKIMVQGKRHALRHKCFGWKTLAERSEKWIDLENWKEILLKTRYRKLWLYKKMCKMCRKNS